MGKCQGFISWEHERLKILWWPSSGKHNCCIISFQICLSFTAFWAGKWHHHPPSLPGPEFQEGCLAPPTPSAPDSVNNLVLSVLTSQYVLDPSSLTWVGEATFCLGCYVSSLAHRVFKHKFEISVPCLTPSSDLDSHQMLFGDFQGSPQSGCRSHRSLIQKQYRRKSLGLRANPPGFTS